MIDTNLAQDLAEKGYQRVIKNYTNRALAEKMLDFYQTIQINKGLIEVQNLTNKHKFQNDQIYFLELLQLVIVVYHKSKKITIGTLTARFTT